MEASYHPTKFRVYKTQGNRYKGFLFVRQRYVTTWPRVICLCGWEPQTMLEAAIGGVL